MVVKGGLKFLWWLNEGWNSYGG